jgi:CubicO group peptidase (beta-lactamase class C family)
MRASFGALLVLSLVGLITALNTLRVTPETLEKQIAGLILSVSQPADPGFAVLVKKGPEIIFAKGYGVREFGKPGKIEPSTNFRLASVTKQFTAMAVMLLVHDGKLRYEDRLTDIWPDFPAYGKAITVRQLLTHTSGLPDYENLMEAEEKAHGPRWSAENQIQDAEVLKLLKAQAGGVFTPGTKWEYSNSGYVVLGLIVAKASGLSYGDFLQERIFAPLGMKNTIVYVQGKKEVENRALGHTREEKSFKVTDQSATSATLGDGGIYSNLEDLAKWDDALTKHPVLSETELSLAWTPVKMPDGSPYYWHKGPLDTSLTPPKVVDYGFGWFLDPYKGHQRQYHDGESIGFRSTIQRFANDNLTIIILSNRTDTSPRALAEKIADMMFAAPKN